MKVTDPIRSFFNSPYSKLFITIFRIGSAVSAAMAAQMIISVNETILVARLGTSELAGLTIGLGAYNIIFLLSLSIISPITQLMAGAMGRNDQGEVRNIAQYGMMLGLIVSVPGTIILLNWQRISLLMPGLLQAQSEATTYLRGAAWGLPIWVLYVAIRCILVGSGRAGTSALFMGLSVPAHLIISWILIFGTRANPPLGLFGAGLAYAGVSFLTVTAITLWECRDKRSPIRLALSAGFRLTPRYIMEIVELGVPMVLRVISKQGVIPVSAFIIASYGASHTAGHLALINISQIAGVFYFGVTSACVSLVGRALGAGDTARARAATWTSVQVSLAGSLMVSAVIYLAPSAIARLMLGDSNAEVIFIATSAVGAVSYFLISEAIQGPILGSLVAFRENRYTLLCSVLGTWCIGVPSGLFLATISATPIFGFWLGLGIGSSASILMLVPRLRQRLDLATLRSSV